MLFMAVTVVLGVLMYLFVQRVVVMKPVGIKGVDEAIDQLIERQKAKSEREEARKRRKAERSWASTTLSEHTMEIIESLEATTCPTERSEACSTATPLQQTQRSCGSNWAAASKTASVSANGATTAVSAAGATTARSMGSAAAGGGKKGETPLEFDKTFDPKEAVARKEQEEGEKKAHRHHHKHHHRHRSRAEEKKEGGESRERSEDSSEEGDDERKSKGGHQKRRHKRHRSKDAGPAPRLDTPIAVPGETLPVPDGVDVEMRGPEAIKTP